MQLDLLSYNPRSAGEATPTFSRSNECAVGASPREGNSLDQSFSGDTFSAPRDGMRLNAQLIAVKQLMADSCWRTLQDIAGYVHASEASVSARLRDLRKEKFGTHTVNRRHVQPGLFEYQLILSH